MPLKGGTRYAGQYITEPALGEYVQGVGCTSTVERVGGGDLRSLGRNASIPRSMPPRQPGDYGKTARAMGPILAGPGPQRWPLVPRNRGLMGYRPSAVVEMVRVADPTDFPSNPHRLLSSPMQRRSDCRVDARVSVRYAFDRLLLNTKLRQSFLIKANRLRGRDAKPRVSVRDSRAAERNYR
jgi:hypothetical protein